MRKIISFHFGSPHRAEWRFHFNLIFRIMRRAVLSIFCLPHPAERRFHFIFCFRILRKTNFLSFSSSYCAESPKESRFPTIPEAKSIALIHPSRDLNLFKLFDFTHHTSDQNKIEKTSKKFKILTISPLRSFSRATIVHLVLETSRGANNEKTAQPNSKYRDRWSLRYPRPAF